MPNAMQKDAHPITAVVQFIRLLIDEYLTRLTLTNAHVLTYLNSKF
jgi:hypothetical protein